MVQIFKSLPKSGFSYQDVVFGEIFAIQDGLDFHVKRFDAPCDVPHLGTLLNCGHLNGEPPYYIYDNSFDSKAEEAINAKINQNMTVEERIAVIGHYYEEN